MEAGSHLTYYPDGRSYFDAVVYTNHTHSGDTWHHLMWVADSADNFLMWFGFIDGPRMDDGNPPPKYPWHEEKHYDPKLFPRIAHAYVYRYSC